MARQLAGKGFDLELQYGKERELELGRLAEHTRIEVKSDRKAARTGNIAVEYQQRIDGRWRPSGIATTKADAQVYEIVGQRCWLWVETDRMKELARLARDKGSKADIGDYGNHRCALVPVDWVTKSFQPTPRTAAAGEESI